MATQGSTQVNLPEAQHLPEIQMRPLHNSALLDLARTLLTVQSESSDITMLLPVTSCLQESSSRYLEMLGSIWLLGLGDLQKSFPTQIILWFLVQGSQNHRMDRVGRDNIQVWSWNVKDFTMNSFSLSLQKRNTPTFRSLWDGEKPHLETFLDRPPNSTTSSWLAMLSLQYLVSLYVSTCKNLDNF